MTSWYVHVDGVHICEVLLFSQVPNHYVGVCPLSFGTSNSNSA